MLRRSTRCKLTLLRFQLFRRTTQGIIGRKRQGFCPLAQSYVSEHDHLRIRLFEITAPVPPPKITTAKTANAGYNPLHIGIFLLG
eukprot:2468930-Ditylum_brightwellii.AAC.1